MLVFYFDGRAGAVPFWVGGRLDWWLSGGCSFGFVFVMICVKLRPLDRTCENFTGLAHWHTPNSNAGLFGWRLSWTNINNTISANY